MISALLAVAGHFGYGRLPAYARWGGDMTSRPRNTRAFLKPVLLSGALALASLLLLWATPHSSAATFTVTKTEDTADGTCDADCSLREAITAANALAGADTITVPLGTYTLTIEGAFDNSNGAGDLDITDAVTINGVAGAPSTFIEACIAPCIATDRVFEVVNTIPTTTATISGVTIRNGRTPDSSGGGGGIQNFGMLTVTDSIITENRAAVTGGGILNYGTLTLNGTTVSSNTAEGFHAGGIYNVGTLALTSSTVFTNSANFDAGGIYNDTSALSLTNSTVTLNIAVGNGGGIFNFNGSTDPALGSVVLTNSTVSDNTTATGSGGGIYNSGEVAAAPGTVALTDSTVSGNTALSGDGGGIFSSGTLT